MSRSEDKKKIRSLAAKTGKRPRGAANILRREAARGAAASAWMTDGVELYRLAYIERAAQKLFEVRPDSHAYTSSVVSNRFVSDEIGPNGEVAMIPKISVTFIESTPAHWWFEGTILFMHEELDAGTEVLHSAEERARLGELIVEHIQREHRWLAERLAHLSVKRVDRGVNLLVDVRLALRDEQEQRFADRVVALQRLNGAASIEMAKGALGRNRGMTPARAAIAAARNALRLVIEAAEIPRQTALAERARRYETTWSRWEESLDRIDLMQNAPSPEEGVRAAREHLAATMRATEMALRPLRIVDQIASSMKVAEVAFEPLAIVDRIARATTVTERALKPLKVLDQLAAIDALSRFLR